MGEMSLIFCSTIPGPVLAASRSPPIKPCPATSRRRAIMRAYPRASHVHPPAAWLQMPCTAHITSAGGLGALALLVVLVAGCSGSSGATPTGGQPGTAATVPLPAAAQDLQQTVIT